MADWIDPSRYIRFIHVAEEVAEFDYTKEIIERSGLSAAIVPAGASPFALTGDYAFDLDRGKRHLFLCRNRGNFFKPCPGTAEYRCCGYHVLNIGMNCPIDCVYCILQAYLNQPWITAFVNIDDMFEEIAQGLDAQPEKFFRIGTGEFTDSLVLERFTGLSRRLVNFIGQRNNGMLELKTKCAYVDTLKDCDHRGKTILSWSLNSPQITRNEEFRAATLAQRLDAAKRAARWGYPLGFHFDPIIYHDGWREGYERTIDMLFDSVPRQAIAWISLGALRFLPSLKSVSSNRFRHSNVFFQEFIPGLDGKSRYFRSLRAEMYRHIYTLLRERAADETCIYFCMESDEIWQEICGFTPDDRGGIPAMLDEAARKATAKY